MQAELTLGEGAALLGLMSEATRDFVLTTGSDGYVRSASRGLEQLGIAMGATLFGPHICDLARPTHAPLIAALHERVLAGRDVGRLVEFPAQGVERGDQWFALQLAPLHADGGAVQGTLGIMRSIDERRVLEDELFSAAMTDPLTGLANRRALLSMIEERSQGEGAGHLALFEIDYFSALTIRHGASCGDRALTAFASLLRAHAGPSHFAAGIGEHRFAMLLCETGRDEAALACRRLLESWPDVARAALGELGKGPHTASAGLVALGRSADDAMKRSELALFLARAKGRNRLEVEGAGWRERLSDLGR